MKFDLIVIGSGPGGYSAALRASKLGAKVAIVERHELGGICLNWGCIPTKTLLKSAYIYREIRKASLYGIEVGMPKLDLAKVMERKNKVVNALKSGIKAQLKANNVEVIKGTARITKINEVCVDNIVLNAGNIIIATGSSPITPPINGIDDSCVIFSDQALSLSEVPSSMVIIGGGVVGLEFATLFNEFGTKVCIIEMKENILPGFDHEVAGEMKKILTRSGIEVITSACVEAIINGTVRFSRDGEIQERSGEKVLVCVGRRANTEGLFSEEVTVRMKSGFIDTDSSMRTSINNIFAIGDVNGREMLAHVASGEGVAAADNALGGESKVSYEAVPKCVYTFPEIATVGLTEIGAIEAGASIKTGKYPLRANGRAIAEGNIEGFAKVISKKESGKIIGAHIVAPYATEMISEYTMAISFGVNDSQMAKIIHPHPSISEILGEAANDLLNQKKEKN